MGALAARPERTEPSRPLGRLASTWRAQASPRCLRWVLGAGVLALCLRLAWVVAVRGIALDGATDQADYVRVGRAWSELNFSTSSLRTPVYPLFIAVGERITDVIPISLRLLVGSAQSVLGSASVIAVGLLGARRFGEPVGVVAALLLAVWPNQVLGPGALMSEQVSTPLMVLAVALALYGPNTAWSPRLSASAVLSGAMVLTRPALLPVALALSVSAMGPLRRERRGIGRLAGYLGLVVLVLVPWMGALSLRAGHPVLSLSTAGSYNLCLGNNPLATGRWSEAATQRHCPWPAGSDEWEEAHELRRTGLRWIRQNLDREPALVRERLEETFAHDTYWLDWYPSWDDYRGPLPHDRTAELLDRWWRVSVSTAAVGIAVSLARRSAITVWLLTICLASIVLPVVSIGAPRFHDQLVPSLCIFAAAALVAVGEAVRAMRAVAGGGPRWGRR